MKINWKKLLKWAIVLGVIYVILSTIFGSAAKPEERK